MNTVLKRVLMTIIGIPVILSIMLFLIYWNYLAFTLVILIFTMLASIELRQLLEKSLAVSIPVPCWIAPLVPAAAHFDTFYLPASFPLLDLLILVLVSIIFVNEIRLGGRDDFAGSARRLTAAMFILAYPALFVVSLIRITALPQAGLLLTLLFLLIFSNDVFAYLFGMLLGKGSRNIVKASPRKSLIGFIGGTVMTVAVGFAFVALIPSSFSEVSFVILLLLFILISFTSNIGDLIESVIKRTAHEKDSGRLMPGRGGILDSIDSIVFSAPFFYLYCILFIFQV